MYLLRVSVNTDGGPSNPWDITTASILYVSPGVNPVSKSLDKSSEKIDN